mmetsp:Transcript_17534/g.43701  ORF Transcript_17534/g.43701 Transcript_17534/m.43701 type:complete len:420 (-) Transcript_17534:2559-3818(-)
MPSTLMSAWHQSQDHFFAIGLAKRKEERDSTAFVPDVEVGADKEEGFRSAGLPKAASSSRNFSASTPDHERDNGGFARTTMKLLQRSGIGMLEQSSEVGDGSPGGSSVSEATEELSKDLQMIWNKMVDSKSANPRERVYTAGMYIATAVVCGAFGGVVRELNPSLLTTVAAMMQVLALFSMIGSILATESIAGFSRRMILLQCASYSFRTASTTQLQGYVPTDETGERLYPALDITACCLCYFALYLVYCVPKYQGKDHAGAATSKCKSAAETLAADTFPILPLLVVALVAALLLKPDLNNSWYFDMTWTMSVTLDTVSVLPQLSVMVRHRKVNAVAAHYLAFLTVAKINGFVFWCLAAEEVGPEDANRFNWSGNGLVVVHALQIVLVGDFIYLYLRAVRHQRLFDTEFDFHWHALDCV